MLKDITSFRNLSGLFISRPLFIREAKTLYTELPLSLFTRFQGSTLNGFLRYFADKISYFFKGP